MTITAISPQASPAGIFPNLGAQSAPNGLFGSFFGDFLSTLTQAAGLDVAPADIGTNRDPLFALLGLDEGQTLADLPPELLDENGQPDLNAIADKLFGEDRPEGDVQSITLTIIQVVTVVYTEVNNLQNAGISPENLGDADALAAAYMKQGYSADEAQAKADSVVNIMKLLDAQIKRLKEMMASLNNGALTAGYVTAAAADTGANPFGFGNAQVSYAAFRSVSVTTTSYTDLTARILRGAPLTTDVQPADDAVKATAEAGENLDLLLPAATDEAPLDDAQLAQLVESAEKIVKAAAQAEKPIVPQQAVAAALAPKDKPVVANAAPTEQTKALVDEALAVKDRVADADIAQPNYRKHEAAPQQQQADDVTWNIKPEAQQHKPQSLDAQTTPVDSDAATPVYKVETSPTGGMQLVNAVTGEVVSTDHAAPQHDAPRAAAYDNRMAELVAQARVIQQVRVHVRTVANHGGGRIDVAINPPELGRVEVNLRIKEGKVSGTITVQRPEVMDHLARELKVLEQGLADAGLSLSGEGLTFQLQEQGAQGQQHGGGNRQAATGGELSGDAGGNGRQTDEVMWLNPDRLVDVNV
ncbi:MAG: hypothetical protein GC134_05225 [Proteobacteria bacterium]|nr:hypothetical protein [Pseudomonadota bacterium]